MDLIKIDMPAAFVKERASLTWRDVLYGLQNELLSPSAAIDFAVEQLVAEVDCAGTTSSSALVELAGLNYEERTLDPVGQLASLNHAQRTLELVEQLASSEPINTDATREKWLYLVLAWIYEHRGNYEDALAKVAEVHADFGYPHRIASFVYNMPMIGPDLGTRERSVQRLYERWREYLGAEERKYAPRKVELVNSRNS